MKRIKRYYQDHPDTARGNTVLVGACIVILATGYVLAFKARKEALAN